MMIAHEKTPKGTPLIERFNRLWLGEPNSGCWLWMGHIAGKDRVPSEHRPRIKINRVERVAHRVSYELYVGPIPEGMFVLHHCDTTLCVNPHHLYLGTNADNMRDKAVRGRFKGSRNSQAKLTEKAVLAIRASDLKHVELAAIYGVSPMTIGGIKRREKWTHV